MKRLHLYAIIVILMVGCASTPLGTVESVAPTPSASTDPGPVAMDRIYNATFCLWGKAPKGRAASTAVCILSDKGYSILATTGHCYVDGTEYTVSNGGRTYPATFFAVSSTYDLGFLWVKASLPVASFGSVPRVGARVYALGNKLGGGHLWPSEGVYGGRVNKGFSVMSAPIHPGNSGGPVVDANGYLIGIASRVLVFNRTQILPTTAMMVPLDNLLEELVASNIAKALYDRPEQLKGPQKVVMPPLPTEFE